MLAASLGAERTRARPRPVTRGSGLDENGRNRRGRLRVPPPLTDPLDQAPGSHADGFGGGHDDVVHRPHFDPVERFIGR